MRRALMVWNFDINSSRVDGEAPLPLPPSLPFWSACGRELTATNPPGEGWAGCVRAARLELAVCMAVPFMRATFEGLEGRMGGAGLAVARLSRIACFRPLSL